MAPSRSSVGLAVLALGTLLSGSSRAEVRIRALADAARTVVGDPVVPRAGDLSVIVELPPGENAEAFGLPRIGDHFSVVRGSLAEVSVLQTLHADWKVTWSPPLRPLLDRAGVWVNGPSFRNETGLTGKDVVVGIVDTGIDPTHADFRNADGSTRLAYLVDFSAAPNHSGEPTPGQEVLDAEARCNQGKVKCRIYSAAAVDAAIALNGGRNLPSDSIGHGTHVASLAAGNGGAEKKFVGMAPEAPLIIARAVDSNGSLSDANVLAATDLVFFLAEARAERLGVRPAAVVNLSLGSDFGPHDGSSSLERGLEDLVGDAHPGRAIIAAAGNSAGLVADSSLGLDRLGVHTDVHVPERTPVNVPLVARPPATATGTLRASLDVWLAFRPGDDLRIGFLRNGAEWIEPKERGFSGAFGSEQELSVTIVNGPLSETPGDLTEQAAVLVSGTFPKTDTFALVLEGHGTASLWIQGEGDLAEDAGGAALLRGATRESTVTIPAAGAGLITVGATLNRTDWIDRLGAPQRILSLGSVRNPALDSVAFFSSGGPTSDGRMKPDLVAPGAFVVGAMSKDADPKNVPSSIFANGACVPPDDCAVVDASHAVTVGTSMASPIVAGAAALLFQEDPRRTTEQIRALLQAGARRPSGATPITLKDTLSAQMGAGVLDLSGVRAVEAARTGPVHAPTAASWLTLGATYAHPDPGYPVPAVLTLRDDLGRVANVPVSELDIAVSEGIVARAAESPEPGLVRFAVAARSATGGDTLVVTASHHGAVVATAELPIAVDVNVLKEGFFARGGCTVGLAPVSDIRWISLSFLLVVGAARRGRKRQRTDSVTV